MGDVLGVGNPDVRNLGNNYNKGDKMKLLWISRHKLDPKAEDALWELFNEVDIVTNPLVFKNDGDSARQQLIKAAQGYDLIGGVFPSQLWLNLMADPPMFKLFVVVSASVQAEDNSKPRSFEFDHIEYYDND